MLIKETIFLFPFHLYIDMSNRLLGVHLVQIRNTLGFYKQKLNIT